MEVQHQCKLCYKTFPSGRSLGGHMRSHVAVISPTTPPPPPQTYVLRDNPKKSSRFSGDPQTCKDCGKQFPSWRSLFGHMRCHSDRARRLAAAETESLTHSQSDSDINIPPVPRKKRGWRPQEYDAEQEEVAVILMMMGQHAPVPVPSLESDEPIGYCENEESDEESMTKKREIMDLGEPEKAKRSRYECGICKKSFSSYQALGGHSASHNKKVLIGSENSVEIEASLGVRKEHVCFICGKIFASGQALGGHKRSHLIRQQPVEVVEMIDLNLPAPMEGDTDTSTIDGNSQFNPWWVGSSIEGEAMLVYR